MTKYLVKKGFITQEIDDSLMIFDGEQSLLFSLNPTGAFIFKMIKEGKTFDEITDLLAQEYDVSQEEASDDVGDYIKTLLDEGIIRSSN